MNDANDEPVNEKKYVGLLEMPMDVVKEILHNVDLATARNLFQLNKSTLPSADLYKRTAQPITMTKLVCTVRKTDVAMRKFNLTVNDGSGSTWTDKKLLILKHSLVPFVHKCAPQQLCLNGSDEFLELDPTWWEKIPKITLNLYDNVLNRYLPMLRHCSQLDIWYSGPCNATDIINSMASVERFKYVGRHIEINDATLSALAAAIRRGRGLTDLEIFTYKARPLVSLEAYVDFIEGLISLYPTGEWQKPEVNVGRFCVRAGKRSIIRAFYERNIEVSRIFYGFRYIQSRNTKEYIDRTVVNLHVVPVPDLVVDTYSCLSGLHDLLRSLCCFPKYSVQ